MRRLFSHVVMPSLLCLSLLPTPAQAQDSIDREEAPGSVVRVKKKEPMSQGLRLGAEALGGIVGAVTGTVGGAVLGAVYARQANIDNFAALGPFLLGATIGNFALLPLGTWLGGRLADGTGGLGWTYLGGLGGTLTAVLTISTLGAVAEGDYLLPLGLGLLALMPIGGAMLAFELSHTDPATQRTEGLSFLPNLGFDPNNQSWSLGLSGSF